MPKRVKMPTLKSCQTVYLLVFWGVDAWVPSHYRLPLTAVSSSTTPLRYPAQHIGPLVFGPIVQGAMTIFLLGTGLLSYPFFLILKKVPQHLAIPVSLCPVPFGDTDSHHTVVIRWFKSK